MPFKEKSGHCPACNKQVLVRRETTNHVLYAILTIFSCGLWGIVWMIQSIAESGKPWLCTVCGLPTNFENYEHYQRLQHSQDSSAMFGQVNTSDSMSPGKIVALVFAGIFGLSVLIAILSAVANTQRDSRSATNQSNSTASPTPIANKNSPDYQAGYKKGFQEGKSWARDTEGGMPYPVGIRVMAQNQAKGSKAKDVDSWQSGWENGFTDGFRSIKPSKIKQEDYEQLSWSNAKPNVKLYDNEGNYKAMIISADQSAGMITVKYGKEGKGAVENKLLDALSEFWFVRKADPALK
jgi:hypothetical protein